jgi:hypothetical protein
LIRALLVFGLPTISAVCLTALSVPSAAHAEVFMACLFRFTWDD